MDLLYTTNKKYVDMMLASIMSVYLNGGLDELNIHIIYNDFSIDEVLHVEKVLKKLKNVNFNFYYVDEKDIDKYGIPMWRGSHIANARLFFQSIIKDNIPEKLLYLDADTICKGKINHLGDYDKSAVYAVKDCLHRAYTQRFHDLENYYNSGVLYIDTKRWDKIDAEGRIIDFALNSPWELVYPDQDIFNCALDPDIGELGVEYNFPPHPYLMTEEQLREYHAYRGVSVEEILNAKERVKICHSYGISGVKPWTDNPINPYNDLFMEYIDMVNSEFKKEEIDFKTKLLVSNKNFYISCLLFKNKLSSTMVVDRGDKHLSKVNKN